MSTYILTKDPKQRAAEMQDLYAVIDDLSLKKEWSIDVSVADSRRQIQNRLLFRWHRQWAEFNGEPTGWAHGSTKLDILLPIKLGCDHAKTVKRAEFEASVLNHVPMREHKIGAAYDLIRSRDIPPEVFAEFLTQYKQLGNEQGCLLQSKKDLEDIALMRAYEDEIELQNKIRLHR